jgi:deoxyhypusine synthase
MNIGDNPTLNNAVEKTNVLKGMLVDYVGEKESPDNDEVTIEMIINTLAEEFPEFLLAVAEENWIRGYHQALTDVEVGQKLYEEEKNKAANEPNEE